MSAHGDDMLTLARQLWGEPNPALSTRKEVRFGRNGSKSVKPDEEVFFDHETGIGGGYRDLYKLVHGTYPPQGQDTAGGFFVPKAMLRELGLPTGQWDYHDEHRRIVARVLRFDPTAQNGQAEPPPKTFRQCRPDGNGWKWSTKGIEIPLYKLPELLTAPADATVLIPEGERKVDALREWGLVATCSIMGARKFRPHNAKTLAGRRCIVLPDNDDAGHAHARIVVRELRKVGAVPFILALPGLGEKGDIVDWIAAGHVRDELDALIADIQATPEAEPEPAPESDDTDAQELPEEEQEALIARLAALSELRYAKQRAGASKLLGIPVGILDRLRKAARGDDAADTRGQGKPLDLPSPDLWPESVNGAAMLHNLRCYFARHLVLPKGGAVAMALWTVHCHCFDVFHFTPRMQFKSVTKGSGKSTAIQLFGYVVPRPLETETITQAFMYRAIEMARPTVLMDEADTYLRDDEDLRGMVNAGVKPGATAGRCVGDNQEPRVFSCHAPIALAGIGSLPGTIEDRCIKILMKRRLRGEAIRPIEDITRLLGERLQRKAARWGRDHGAELRALRPEMKPLFNRAADRWRALYAIAEIAGGDWPALAREAMQALASADDDDADSLGERLLADIKVIFDEACPVTELETREIVERLVLMDNRPWPEMGRSHKPLTTTRFTQMAGKFGVRRRRAYDAATQKMGAWGFRLTDFAEAFGRYLDA